MEGIFWQRRRGKLAVAEEGVQPLSAAGAGRSDLGRQWPVLLPEAVLTGASNEINFYVWHGPVAAGRGWQATPVGSRSGRGR